MVDNVRVSWMRRWAACVTLMMFWWSFIVHQGPLPHGQYMVTSMSNTQSFGLITNFTLDTLFKMANETLESSMSVCLYDIKTS